MTFPARGRERKHAKSTASEAGGSRPRRGLVTDCVAAGLKCVPVSEKSRLPKFPISGEEIAPCRQGAFGEKKIGGKGLGLRGRAGSSA